MLIVQLWARVSLHLLHPQLDALLKEKQPNRLVEDADNSLSTVSQSWIAANGKATSLIGRLGGGSSDHSSFLQHRGIPAMDIYVGKDYPVYCSLYDDLLWMKKLGDPSFHRHVAGSYFSYPSLKRVVDFSLAIFGSLGGKSDCGNEATTCNHRNGIRNPTQTHCYQRNCSGETPAISCFSSVNLGALSNSFQSFSECIPDCMLRLDMGNCIR
eukprot:Gb_30246 [translate_table: standard]